MVLHILRESFQPGNGLKDLGHDGLPRVGYLLPYGPGHIRLVPRPAKGQVLRSVHKHHKKPQRKVVEAAGPHHQQQALIGQARDSNVKSGQHQPRQLGRATLTLNA